MNKGNQNYYSLDKYMYSTVDELVKVKVFNSSLWTNLTFQAFSLS